MSDEPWAGPTTPGWSDVGTGPTVGVRIERPPPRYAGITRRAVGLVVDNLLVWLATTAVWTPLLLLTLLDAGSRADSLAESTRGSALLVGLLMATVLAMFLIWFGLIPRRMSTRGSTPGMALAGLRIIDTDGNGPIGQGRAFVRALVASLMFLVSAMVTYPLQLLVLDLLEELGVTNPFTEFESEVVLTLELTVSGVIVVAAVSVFVYAPTITNLFTPRKQTLYDMALGTAVVKDSGL